MRTLSYRIQEQDEGRMVKRIVRSALGVSHRQFGQLKGQEGVRLDGQAVHADVRVRAGQLLEVYLEDREGQEIEPVSGSLVIRYEDEDLLIVDKPAPLAAQTSLKLDSCTLANYVAYYYRDQPNFVFRPVNRLDKGTSGLMVIAKHAHAHHLMQQQLHTPAFVRAYEAIVEGRLEPLDGVIDAPIAKADGATIRREVRPDGKRCVTHYYTLEQSAHRSRLYIQLETGRTHQIRVHLSSRGCPIAGDFLYGQELASLPGRFALHSTHLECRQPVTGQRLSLDAPLPKELARLMGE